MGGFFVPAAVLSAVHPTVVKLQLRDLHVTGQVVGRLSALGTAGAIVGTFIAGFILVAAAPTSTVIVAVGAVLVAGGGACGPAWPGPALRSACWSWPRSWRWWPAALRRRRTAPTTWRPATTAPESCPIPSGPADWPLP